MSLLVLSVLACSDKKSEDTDHSMTVAEMLAQQQASADQALEEEQGRFDKYETYLATIHSYTAPEEGLLVNSHIVETDNALVLIDAQFLNPYAQQLRDYIDALGKPLDRIYLSHEHPDHWFGLTLFPEIPTYTSHPVAEAISENNQSQEEFRHQEFGVPETPVKVDVLRVHSDIVDGVTYEFELVEGAETDYQMLIRLPEINVSFAQDLISNNAHSFVTGADLQTWIRSLAVLSVDAKDHQIYVGHGYPARVDAKQINRQIEYLQTVGKILANQGDTATDETAELLKAAYPGFGATRIADSSASYYQHSLESETDSQHPD